MARDSKPGFWKRGRRIIRLARITLLGACLLLVGCLFYLNLVGLPRFAETALIRDLHRRGLDVRFSHFKLRFLQGLVAENIRFGDLEDATQPVALCREMAVGIDWTSLLRLRFVPDSLVIKDGFMRLPLGNGNEKPFLISLRDLSADLYFPMDDIWRIRQCTAFSSGIRFDLSGTLTNAWAAKDWFQPGREKPDLRFLQRLLQEIENSRFSSPPTFKVSLNGDAANANRLYGGVSVRIARASGDWGSIDRLLLDVQANPRQASQGWCDLMVSGSAAALKTGETQVNAPRLRGGALIDLTTLRPQRVEFDLDAASVTHGDLARSRRVELTLRSSPEENPASPAPASEGLLDTTLRGTIRELAASAFNVDQSTLDLEIHHTLDQWLPRRVEGTIELSDAHGVVPKLNEADVDSIRIQLSGRPLAAGEQVEETRDWVWWRPLAPYGLDVDAQAVEFNAPGLRVERSELALNWLPPILEIKKLRTRIDGRDLEFQGKLNVATRRLSTRGSLNLDLKKIAEIFTDKVQERLGKVDWTVPPQVALESELTLPAWTNTAPDWKNEVQPTLQVRGNFEAGEASFRTIPLLSARGRFVFTNECWSLPNLEIQRPEGNIHLDCFFEPSTKFYSVACEGQSFIRPLRPLFGEKTREIVGTLRESGPATMDVIVYGPWNIGRGALDGTVLITNFTFRGQHWDRGHASFDYTNNLITIHEGEFTRGNGKLDGQGIRYEEEEKLLSVGQAVSTVDPMVIAATIGPETAGKLEPYRFATPPRVRVEGTVDLKNHAGTDMSFDVDGGPFHYWKFNLTSLKSLLRWKGERLDLKDVNAGFYDGSLRGIANFNFENPDYTPFMFQLAVTNSSLKKFLADFSENRTNNVEGIFGLQMNVSSTNVANFNTWQGFGDAELKDGLIWDVPVVGIFSPVLNTFVPGLGNVRADQASASFELREGKIFTDDLYIRGPSFGLKYQGTIDLNGNLDAQAEAQIFKETGLLGSMLDAALSPLTETFKYKVTGTLSSPQSRPLYLIPKILLFPLRPFKTLEELSTPRTNSPSQNVQPPRR